MATIKLLVAHHRVARKVSYRAADERTNKKDVSFVLITLIDCLSCPSGIMLAIRAHLNYYGKRRGIAFPELICCSTAHAAVDKACDVFGIRKVCIPCDPNTFTLSSNQVRSRITSNTILIYASAPCYPQGVIDPIEQLGQLALEYSFGLHVDACLGGFILPFCKPLGYEIPKFDFECPGVTSMSVDTHKYGYASKGTSVVLYRTKELRHGQYFSYSKWSGTCVDE